VACHELIVGRLTIGVLVVGASCGRVERMVGEAGTVDDRTVIEVAVAMRALLAALDDGRVGCSAWFSDAVVGRCGGVGGLGSG
jgi:hypothetical protein